MSKAEQPVQPGSGRWLNAPADSCEHDRVVILSDVAGNPAGVDGRTVLWCNDCEATWWEDLSNVQKS